MNDNKNTNKINTNNNSTKKLGLVVLVVTIIAMLSLGYSIQPVSAYEIDTHYYLTFFLALYAGFTWDEARLIASGDQRMDETGLVAGEPVDFKWHPLTANPNNFDWHALSTNNNDKTQRLADLKQRSFDETDVNTKLVKFGQYLHYLQDMEPHNTYNSLYGHAVPGHAPDSPANDPGKFEITTIDTLISLNDLLTNMGRSQKILDIPNVIQPVIDDIIYNSEPADSGFGITSNYGQYDNRVTIEYAIATHQSSENLDIPWSVWWYDGRPLISDVIAVEFDVSDGSNRGDPTNVSSVIAGEFNVLSDEPMDWDSEHYTHSLTSSGIIESQSGGFKFPDGSIQTTSSIINWDHSFWSSVEDGNDIYYNGGNVGIGTTNPTFKLHILNTDYINNDPLLQVGSSVDLSDGLIRVAFNNGAGESREWDFGIGNYALFGHNTSFGFKDRSGNTIMVLGSSEFGGNVGIGTIYPNAKLDVAGTIRAQQICDESGNNCNDMSDGWVNLNTEYTQVLDLENGGTGWYDCNPGYVVTSIYYYSGTDDSIEQVECTQLTGN